ncbi:hypothetical protein [Lignipirellula cremea]|uniref:Uncharacterized protein n=1 Tax=Lignipirellula cremea TaxID=2528010 RepID=A0A518DZF0_9BACT|nr:hypothetical protein [Lignipirellula cremea]QDU97202.1 hypothetical protein Pla8534_50470 [Lignipirellula cremea]
MNQPPATEQEVAALLRRAKLYRGLGWFQLVNAIIFALAAYFTTNVAATITVSFAVFASMTGFMADLAHRKTAAIRRLEMRVQALETALENIRPNGSEKDNSRPV